jgi:hypothetical protein
MTKMSGAVLFNIVPQTVMDSHFQPPTLFVTVTMPKPANPLTLCMSLHTSDPTGFAHGLTCPLPDLPSVRGHPISHLNTPSVPKYVPPHRR